MKASLLSGLFAMMMTIATGYSFDLKEHTGLTTALFVIALVAWIIAVLSIIWMVLVYQEKAEDEKNYEDD